ADRVAVVTAAARGSTRAQRHPGFCPRTERPRISLRSIRATNATAASLAYSIVMQPSFVDPRFDRAWGLPVSFPFPPSEGVWRAGADAEEENAPVQRAPGFFPLSRSTVPGPGQALSSWRGCSGVRPGVQLRTTPAGAGPAPPSRRLMKAPLDGRDVYNLGLTSPKVKQMRNDVNIGPRFCRPGNAVRWITRTETDRFGGVSGSFYAAGASLAASASMTWRDSGRQAVPGQREQEKSRAKCAMKGQALSMPGMAFLPGPIGT